MLRDRSVFQETLTETENAAEKTRKKGRQKDTNPPCSPLSSRICLREESPAPDSRPQSQPWVKNQDIVKSLFLCFHYITIMICYMYHHHDMLHVSPS